MKINYFRITTVFFVVSIFAGLLFGNASPGFAQSSQAWSDPINISRSGIAKNPHLIIDAQGVLHAIWEDQLEEFKYSKSIDGMTWSNPITARYPFVKGQPVQFVVDHEGVVNVFWVDKEHALMLSRVIPAELDKPYSWDSSYRLARFVLDFHVEITVHGAMHAGIITTRSPSGVYYRSSLGGGRSWSEAKLLYESSYFRSITLANAHVQVTASDDPADKKVYVVWDNQSQKRVFMASSVDGGVTWSESNQIKGPEDAGGFGAPYNAEAGIIGDELLLIWQVGEPGASQCAVYAQRSPDGGESWKEPEAILDHRSACPQSLNVIAQNEEYSIVLFTNLGSPSLAAWDGEKWSDIQPQNEMLYFSNPLTFETILFGCQTYTMFGDQLYQIACDLGKGGDIWLTSRSLSSWESWFPPSSIWSLPAVLENTTNRISSLAYTTDNNSIHAVWVDSPLSETIGEDAVFYARWNGDKWSSPQIAITGLNGKPTQLAFTANGTDRLMLVWVNEKNSELLFSWANSQRATSRSEWADPINLPIPSKLSNAPEILVDGAGRILVVYAVPFNEDRGVYLVQSSDNGITWSSPQKVFDAALADWQIVNHPKISLGGDGRLHLLYTRYSALNNQSTGLYYSQSSDGGLTWIAPEEVSDGNILWSEVVSYGKGTVHRLWQESDNSVVANLDQISNNSGDTWAGPVNVTPISDIVAPVSVIFNGTKELHFIQLREEDSPSFIKEYYLSVQDSRWDGAEWTSQPFQELVIKGEKAQYAIVGGITLNGHMGVAIHAEYNDLSGELINEVIQIGRSFSSQQDTLTQVPGVIIIPSVQPVITEAANTQPPLFEQTALPDELKDASPPTLRNLIGAGFFVVIVISLAVILLRRTARSK